MLIQCYQECSLITSDQSGFTFDIMSHQKSLGTQAKEVLPHQLPSTCIVNAAKNYPLNTGLRFM